MSGNISDKCYVYFDKPLEFYLDDVLFQAAPNMTWEEWLNSSYSDGWSYKQRIKPYDQLISEGYTRKPGYFPFGTNSETYDRNLLLVVMDNIVNELIIFTSSDVQCKAGCSNNIPIERADKISDSFQGVYDFILQAGNHSNISNKELTDNYYWISYFYSSCLSPNTLIDVEEIDEKGKKRRRRKKLKDIKVGDKVICINPVTLELDTDTVIECDGEMNKKHTCYDNWYFDDGTIITTVHRHRFYNVENSKFMYMEEWNIGEHGINIENKKIKLIKHEHIEEEIKHCTLFTEKYNNYFANGLLSGNRKSKNIVL